MTITATLARVRDLDAKATPGPWEWDGQCYILAAEGMVADTGPSPFPDEPMGPDDILQARGAGSDAPIDENMALVAAYRTDAVVLATEVERLRAVLRGIGAKSAAVFRFAPPIDHNGAEYDRLCAHVYDTISLASSAVDGAL